MTPVDSWATQSPLLLPTVSARAPARAGVSGPSGALPHGTSIQVVLRCDAVKHPFFGVGVFAICLRHASRLFGDVELATPTVGASLTCAGPPLDGSKPGLDEQAAPSAEKNRIGTKPYRKCMGLSFELEVVAAGARHRRLRVSRSIAIRAPCAAPPALRPFLPCDDAGPRRPQRSAQQSQRRRCCAGCCGRAEEHRQDRLLLHPVHAEREHLSARQHDHVRRGLRALLRGDRHADPRGRRTGTDAVKAVARNPGSAARAAVGTLRSADLAREAGRGGRPSRAPTRSACCGRSGRIGRRRRSRS